MATPVIMPQQGQSVESCLLVEWLVAPGTEVTEGQPLANIETDKAVFELESPAAGVLLDQFFTEGDDVPVLTTIGAIGTAGEDASALRPGSDDSANDAETAAAELPTSDIQHSTSKDEQPATGQPATDTRQPAAAPGISPRARRMAQAAGIDAASLTGTGPGGRVIERDIAAARDSGPRISPAARDAMAGTGLAAPAAGSGPGGMVLAADLQAAAAPLPAASEDVEIPVRGIRKVIAERMHESLASTAQLTLTRRVNAGAILAYRKGVKEHGDHFGLPNITVNDMLVFAVARTLRMHPALNAHFLGDRIVQQGAVNLGVAVDTERGLMVPVVRDADRLPLTDVSGIVGPLAEACRNGTIKPNQLSGGTFTITNLGVLGIEQFTPILNPPEVAILGVGGLGLCPVRDNNGDVTYADMLHLSLTINHQAVDGAPGARFLQDLATAIEQFSLLVGA